MNGGDDIWIALDRMGHPSRAGGPRQPYKSYILLRANALTPLHVLPVPNIKMISVDFLCVSWHPPSVSELPTYPNPDAEELTYSPPAPFEDFSGPLPAPNPDSPVLQPEDPKYARNV